MKRVTIAVCDECGFENSKDNFCENCNKEIQWSTFIEETEYKQAAQDLARITAQLDAAISDLQDAVDYVYNVYGENNETLAAITTAHWRAVIADVKKKRV